MNTETITVLRRYYPSKNGNMHCMKCGTEYADSECGECKTSAYSVNTAFSKTDDGKELISYIRNYKSENGVEIAPSELEQHIKEKKLLKLIEAD